MYQFLDRPVDGLVAGSRLLLWATRGWAQARLCGGCPPGAIAPAFVHCGAAGALPHVHRLLLLIEGGDSNLLDLPPLDHDRVEDLEAVLLQLWADVLTRPSHARETLELMLRDEAGEADGVKVGAAFEALAGATAALATRGLAPIGLADARGANA